MSEIQTATVCPMCDGRKSRPSWNGSVYYREREYEYLECLDCKSLYCRNMPNPETLSLMYGTDYEKLAEVETFYENQKDKASIRRWLTDTPKGVFLDYGCGGGETLELAKSLGWKVIGVELDEEVAENLRKRLGVEVYSNPDELPDGVADLLNLGDVIEHLTDMNRQFPAILRLIKKGGLLMAQGPLEANFNLFIIGLRIIRYINIKSGKKTVMPPYHVILATLKGQNELFRRMDLTKKEMIITEVDFPAPDRWRKEFFTRPREAVLFFLRQTSQLVSKISLDKLGNRYFYVGSRN